MHQRLPIALAQLKAGNTSKNKLNKLCVYIYIYRQIDRYRYIDIYRDIQIYIIYCMFSIEYCIFFISSKRNY